MPRKSKIQPRNQSPHGWWIYKEVEYWVPHQKKKLTANNRTTARENLRIIKAKNRDEAYRKAMKISSQYGPTILQSLSGEWRFAGISMLLPIYEELEDGAEVLWISDKKMTQKSIQKLVKTKEQLSVFDDSERED